MRQLNPEERLLLENEAPTIPKETTMPGLTQPKSIRTKREGQRRADLETPDRPEPEFEDNLWATLPSLKPPGGRHTV